MSIDLFGPTVGAAGVTTRPTETRSFGAADTFFNDCSSQTADDGTEYQAAFFNAVLANWRSLGRGNGQTAGAVDVVTQDNSDDSLILKAVQYLIQRGQPTAAVDTGTAGHVVAAFSPAVIEHKFGTRLSVKILNSNTTAGGVTDFAPNTLSALPILRIGGAALQPYDLQAGGVAELFCMGPGTHYEIVSFIPPAGGSTTKAPKLIGFMAGSTGQSIPTSAGTTLNWGTTLQNNMWGTSTWDGTTLTVGAGEAGLWFFGLTFGFDPGASAGDDYLAGLILQNGATALAGDSEGGPTATAATSHNMTVTGIVKLAAADTVTAQGYQQSGSALTTSATSGKFSGFLISSY